MTEFPDPLPVRVDFAFGADPDVTPDEGQWTTVPDDHWISQSIAISRGRQNEEDPTQAASWSFQLLNDSGNYTPDLVNSPHYPHLKLGLPCRIRVGSMVRAIGNVAEITPEWPAGDIDPGHSLVGVTVGGFLRRLGQGDDPLNSALTRYFTNHPDVLAYWPGEDGENSGSLSSPIRDVRPITPSGVEFASGDSPAGSTALMRVLPGARGIVGRVPTHTATDRYVVQQAFKAPELTSGLRVAMSVRTSSAGAAGWWVRYSSSQVAVQVIDADGTQVLNSTATIHPDFADRWLRIVLELEQVGSGIDWRATILTADTDAETLNQLSGTLSSTALGRVTQLGADGTAAATPAERFRGHIVVMRKSSDTLTADHDPWHGHTGETAADRFERLCQEEGLSCTVIGTAADTMPMGPQRPNALVEQLQEIADTDGGILAESREVFGFEYRTRVSMYNQEPALELDAGTFPGDITHPFTPTLDDQQIRNDVTAEQSGGSSARTVDEDDIRGRGRYQGTVAVNVAGDSRLTQVASWRLHHGTYPGMRYPSISPGLTQVPDLISEWVTVELGDRIRVFGLPDEHPVDDVDLLMQGYVETLEPQGWNVEANASPARPWNVFELEHETFGRLWSPRAYLGEDIDDEATSFVVVVPVQRALNPVPGFESEITVVDESTASPNAGRDWATFRGQLVRSTEQAFRGHWSGRFTPQALSNPAVYSGRQMGVVASGLAYAATFWVWPVNTVTLGLLIESLRGNTLLDTVNGTPVSVPAGQWTRLHLPATSVPGSTSVRFALFYSGTPSTGDVIYIDDGEIGRPDAPFEVDTGLSTPIIVGGERMTVSAIGADDGTGAQTFTVTRSVNGVAKPHAAGAPVRLWPGHVMGL